MNKLVCFTQNRRKKKKKRKKKNGFSIYDDHLDFLRFWGFGKKEDRVGAGRGGSRRREGDAGGKLWGGISAISSSFTVDLVA